MKKGAADKKTSKKKSRTGLNDESVMLVLKALEGIRETHPLPVTEDTLIKRAMWANMM